MWGALQLADRVQLRAGEATDDEVVAMWWTNERRVAESGAGVALLARVHLRHELERRKLYPLA